MRIVILGARHTLALVTASLANASRWVCMLAMLTGRLEIFSLIVLCAPGFWRK